MALVNKLKIHFVSEFTVKNYRFIVNYFMEFVNSKCYNFINKRGDKYVKAKKGRCHARLDTKADPGIHDTADHLINPSESFSYCR
jgi:hypothetical protein